MVITTELYQDRVTRRWVAQINVDLGEGQMVVTHRLEPHGYFTEDEAERAISKKLKIIEGTINNGTFQRNQPGRVR